ncbi:MAG: DUF3870 domain-containing protein [Sporomusaceae bacterium]|nr:DUF3870 domain-containing protein [Sporomusaceae bacterium]
MGRETRNKILFSAYARLPEGTCGAEVVKTIGIVVVVDINDGGRIIDAECTLPTGVARKLIAELLIGRSLAANPEQLVSQIAAVFQDSSLRAVIAAVRTLYNRYASHIQAAEARPAITMLPERRFEGPDATAAS